MSCLKVCHIEGKLLSFEIIVSKTFKITLSELLINNPLFTEHRADIHNRRGGGLTGKLLRLEISHFQHLYVA